MWPAAVIGIVFAGAMKGSGYAMAAAEDAIVEAGILVADVVSRIAMRPIGGLAASLSRMDQELPVRPQRRRAP
ncbi:hypothetical protein GCM10010869_59030 [Mesorhizobium tianshanense]|nr:hypothetical protein GCM10010869_59030 [Mesorhizobium tianshanense]